MSGQPSSGQIRITLLKSKAGQLSHISASVRGLGLRKIRQSVVVKDTPEIRGMIRTASHMLKVEEAAK